ncbi:hypothetical protein KKA50_01320, partial [Patescibacteria group bacterium]|nr:hypothetical protein [Patescibacteria group bacterium]
LEFKILLDKINISKLPSGYICKYSTMKECYADEPILQSAGVPTMILEINGIQKEIHMSTSNGMPNMLKEIMKKMISIRDDLATMPWSEQTSTYKQLFN